MAALGAIALTNEGFEGFTARFDNLGCVIGSTFLETWDVGFGCTLLSLG